MSSPGTKSDRRGKCPGCTADPKRPHTDDELFLFHSRRYQFEQATKGVNFTKDFNPALEALMRDPLETFSSRVLSWIKRMAWGNHCLHCIKEDGSPAFLTDCAADLGIDKRRVSEAAQYLESRGYLERGGTAKLLYPSVCPSGGPPPDSQAKSGEYRTFLQLWKVSHSADFLELEAARSTVLRLRKVLLSDYKQWLASRTESSAIKEESFRVNKSMQAGATAAAEAEADMPACMPSPLPSPSQNQTPAPVPLARLAGLRECFPGELLPAVALEGLDDHLAEQLGAGYERQAYVEFVERRQSKGKIGAGLAFDHEGLPHDFCEWVRGTATRDRAQAEARARREREAAETAENEEIIRVQEVLTNPLSSPEEIAEAQTHPSASGFRPDPERARALFDHAVMRALADIGRGCMPQWRTQCDELLRRAEGVDAERVQELRMRGRPRETASRGAP